MRFRSQFALLMALLVLGLSIYEYAIPSRQNRIGPGTLLAIAMLLGLRYVFARQAQKRSDLAERVPPRPLGLAEESADRK
ncbi:MAG: hypothetical protein M3N41_00715 [Acidobacteriota bacterium]|nr:hypothetical protein [Acidobacteriota bacterium]